MKEYRSLRSLLDTFRSLGEASFHVFLMDLLARLLEGEIAAGPSQEFVGLPALRAPDGYFMGMHRLEEGHMRDPVAAEPVDMAVLLLSVHRNQSV